MAILSPALDPAQPTGMLLDGAFAGSGDDLDVVNPYTGETIATVAVGGPADVDSAVAGALRHLPPPPPPSAPPFSSGPRAWWPSAPRPSRARSAWRPASR